MAERNDKDRTGKAGQGPERRGPSDAQLDAAIEGLRDRPDIFEEIDNRAADDARMAVRRREHSAD